MPKAKKTTGKKPKPKAKKEVKKKVAKKGRVVKKDKEVKKPKSVKKKEEPKKKKTEELEEKKPKYFEAVGRRKTSTARVRLFTQGGKDILVNNKSHKDYFAMPSLQKVLEAPLEKLNCLDKFKISVKVRGGGLHGQAEACRHGISRALVLLNPYFKKRLKKAGFLTRDPRMRERKKPGLKRARRAPQWSKR